MSTNPFTINSPIQSVFGMQNYSNLQTGGNVASAQTSAPLYSISSSESSSNSISLLFIIIYTCGAIAITYVIYKNIERENTKRRTISHPF